ncbi:MAG: glycosyltransferase [Thermoanaerobaculia bacterium]
MKLLKFVTLFAVGGTERQFVNLALSLEPSRFAVHFGCLRRWGRLLEQIDERGIPVFDYEVSTFRNLKALRAQWRLARDIRRHGIQIVHTYNFYANVFAIPAAKLAGAHVVASIRDMGAYLSPRQRFLQRVVCRFADQILVNATAIKDWLVADGYAADRIMVIPNGVDLTRFEQPARTGSLHHEFGLPNSAPLIGLVGRLAHLKGLEDFLTAAAVIARRFPSARFVIVGDAVDESYMAALKQQAAQLGLEDGVIFTGYRSDVECILAELSVSVLPSLSEGLSNALLESMAAGAAVVATRVGGTAEALHDGENGLLVPPSDPDAIANAVCRLLDTPGLASRLGLAARRSIVERYSMTRMVERTSLVYEALLEHDGHGVRTLIAQTDLTHDEL